MVHHGDSVLHPYTKFEVRRPFRSEDIVSISRPGDLDLWPWSSRRLWLMRVFVLRLCTKFQVRRPSSSRYWAFTVWALIHLVTLTFWPLNRFTASTFGLPRPFRSRVILRHGTDGRTDRHRGPFYNVSFPTGRRYSYVGWRLFYILVYTVGCALDFF